MDVVVFINEHTHTEAVVCTFNLCLPTLTVLVVVRVPTLLCVSTCRICCPDLAQRDHRVGIQTLRRVTERRDSFKEKKKRDAKGVN